MKTMAWKRASWKHGLLTLLACAALTACGSEPGDSAAINEPATPNSAEPAPQVPVDAGISDPYATTPPPTDPMAQQDPTGMTGDTSDRCAGLAGQALSDCLETERVRQQMMQNRDETQEEIPEQ